MYLIIFGILSLSFSKFISPVYAVAPASCNNGARCQVNFMRQSSGSYFMSAGLTSNLYNLGYQLTATSIASVPADCSCADADSPDCEADCWFNGNLPVAAQNANILMFKSCFHLITLSPTTTDLERWKSKYLNRFIYGTGGAGCSGVSCNGYAKSHPDQLIIPMSSIPFSDPVYGGRDMLAPSNIGEAWGEWLKKDFVSTARAKGINNIVSFDVFDYFADGKSDPEEGSGNNLQCAEFIQPGNPHLNSFANNCAAGSNGADPSLLTFIDSAANDFFPDKNADKYKPASYRCRSNLCPAIISGGTLPTNTPIPSVTMMPVTQTPTPSASCISVNSGNLDCDNSGLINETDLNILLGQWWTSGCPAPTPANPGYRSANIAGTAGECKVDESDLNKLLSNWKSQ